jgi:hypothetical protein
MRSRPLRPALGWALLILVLCLMPGAALPTWRWADLISLDKGVHAFLFGGLYVLLVRGLRQQYQGHRLRSRAVVVALLVSVTYGGLTELMQQLPVLGRRGDLLDLAANTAGVVLGLVYDRRSLGAFGAAPSTKDA